MKRIFFLTLVLWSVRVSCAPCLFAQSAERPWADKSGFFRDKAVSDIQVLEDRCYLSTQADLYRSDASRERWDSIFSLPSGSNEINCIAASGDREVYVGTTRGLFKSGDAGAHWKNVFKTIVPEKSDVLCIAVSASAPGHVAIGTRKGVFLSKDRGGHWADISSIVRNKITRSVAVCGTYLFAGGECGLFRTGDEGVRWERLLVRSGTQEEGDRDSGEDRASEEEAAPSREVRSIATDGVSVYVALDTVVYYSTIVQESWKTMPDTGLQGRINCILVSKKAQKIFAATSKGAYEYLNESQRWSPLEGVPRANVNRISFESSREDLLWAATDKGLFRAEAASVLIERRTEVEGRLKEVFVGIGNEPAYRELQQAAIRHAEAGPEKIRAWRTGARVRALIPKISFGTGMSHATNSEIYTSATKDYIVIGPDDESRNFSASISWELGDLIWSDDQTAIDVRSRLTVQLRNDILDDLRRVYFERKRVQFELLAMPPKDLKARFEKELRLRELTQAIDDLTGNYLSDAMRN